MAKCPRCGMMFYANDGGWAKAKEKAQKTHKRAFEPWSPEEDERLLQMVQDGISPKEIAKTLERQPGAIAYRLNLLGIKISKVVIPNPEEAGAIIPAKSLTWAEKEAEDLKNIKEKP